TATKKNKIKIGNLSLVSSAFFRNKKKTTNKNGIKKATLPILTTVAISPTSEFMANADPTTCPTDCKIPPKKIPVCTSEQDNPTAISGRKTIPKSPSKLITASEIPVSSSLA